MTMTKKNQNTSMFVCLIAAVLAVMKMYTGSNVFMVLFTCLMAFAILLDKMENKIDYIIFFSTWAYVLKFSYSGHSVFLFLSLEYCALGIYSLFQSGKKFDGKFWVTVMGFLAYSFLVSMLSSANVNGILGILVNYLTCALALMFFSDSDSIKKWMWLFVVGMLVQSIVAFWALDSFGQVGEYLRTLRNYSVITSSGVVSRFAGFESDPNYFSVEVLVALCGLIIYMTYEKKLLLSTSTIGFLALVGLMTLSKMYLLCLCILVLITIVTVFKYKVSSGFIILAAFGVVAAIIWKIFGAELLSGFNARIEDIDNISGLTTGRTDNWIAYINEIFGNFKVFVFGAGYGSGFVDGKAAHNGFLSLFYFWGLIGSTLFFNLLKKLDKIVAEKFLVEKRPFLSLGNIMLLIVLLANFSLDCVLMDFFPMAIFLVIIGRYYGCKKNETEVYKVKME